MLHWERWCFVLWRCWVVRNLLVSWTQTCLKQQLYSVHTCATIRSLMIYLTFLEWWKISDYLLTGSCCTLWKVFKEFLTFLVIGLNFTPIPYSFLSQYDLNNTFPGFPLDYCPCCLACHILRWPSLLTSHMTEHCCRMAIQIERSHVQLSA